MSLKKKIEVLGEKKVFFNSIINAFDSNGIFFCFGFPSNQFLIGCFGADYF